MSHLTAFHRPGVGSKCQNVCLSFVCLSQSGICQNCKKRFEIPTVALNFSHLSVRRKCRRNVACWRFQLNSLMRSRVHMAALRVFCYQY